MEDIDPAPVKPGGARAALPHRPGRGERSPPDRCRAALEAASWQIGSGSTRTASGAHAKRAGSTCTPPSTITAGLPTPSCSPSEHKHDCATCLRQAVAWTPSRGDDRTRAQLQRRADRSVVSTSSAPPFLPWRCRSRSASHPGSPPGAGRCRRSPDAPVGRAIGRRPLSSCLSPWPAGARG